jgi:hypothetical protein
MKVIFLLFPPKLLAPKTSKIFTHGFPPLALLPPGISDSKSSDRTESYGEAELKIRSFALLESIPHPDITSRLWSLFEIDSRPAFLWNSEEDIRIRVVHAMEDIIDAAGLRDKVKLNIELGIFRERPDLLVVMVTGFPIGVVEVKKPGENVISNPKVWGQFYDCLLRLSSFYGIQHVRFLLLCVIKIQDVWNSNYFC